MSESSKPSDPSRDPREPADQSVRPGERETEKSQTENAPRTDD